MTADVNDGVWSADSAERRRSGRRIGSDRCSILVWPLSCSTTSQSEPCVTNPLLDANASRRLRIRCAGRGNSCRAGCSRQAANAAPSRRFRLRQSRRACRSLRQHRQQTARSLPSSFANVSVRRGQGTLDIIIDGPSSAHPFLLKNPDRLVLDFNNAVMRPAVGNIAVHTRDVLRGPRGPLPG